MRLEAQDLACVRGGREVFSDLNFSISDGEALSITGRNGAGKSTLLRAIAGLVRIAHGQLILTGGDTEHTLIEQAHYLGHQDALKPSLTVLENLAFWTRYLGDAKPASGVLEEALTAAGLASLAGLPAAYLSAGQRRRLSIARLLAIKRPIWLLDEPTSTLDRQAQQQFSTLMRQHLASGGMIAVATHGPVGLDGARELRLGADA